MAFESSPHMLTCLFLFLSYLSGILLTTHADPCWYVSKSIAESVHLFVGAVVKQQCERPVLFPFSDDCMVSLSDSK